MKIDKVGLMTPGDMGQAVAMQIKAKGFTVCTAIERRSERSRTLAREAGLTDLGTIARLVIRDAHPSRPLAPGSLSGRVAVVLADGRRARRFIHSPS